MLDQWTAETVRQMCRYIADNRHIARHVGCSIADVETARRQCHVGADARMIARVIPPAPKAEIRHAACEVWARDARKATETLAEALARYRGSAA